MGADSLPPMPYAEIAPHYRRRDWIPALWSMLRFWASVVGRINMGEYRTGPLLAWHLAWNLDRNDPWMRAVKRACLARGYDGLPCDLIFQMPRRGR